MLFVLDFHHINEVKSWGTPHTTPAQEVKPEVKAEATQVIPAAKAVETDAQTASQ